MSCLFYAQDFQTWIRRTPSARSSSIRSSISSLTIWPRPRVTLLTSSPCSHTHRLDHTLFIALRLLPPKVEVIFLYFPPEVCHAHLPVFLFYKCKTTLQITLKCRNIILNSGVARVVIFVLWRCVRLRLKSAYLPKCCLISPLLYAWFLSDRLKYRWIWTVYIVKGVDLIYEQWSTGAHFSVVLLNPVFMVKHPQILIEGGFECIKMKCIHFTVQHLWLILYITIVSISRWIGDLISVKRKTEEVDENVDVYMWLLLSDIRCQFHTAETVQLLAWILLVQTPYWDHRRAPSLFIVRMINILICGELERDHERLVSSLVCTCPSFRMNLFWIPDGYKCMLDCWSSICLVCVCAHVGSNVRKNPSNLFVLLVSLCTWCNWIALKFSVVPASPTQNQSLKRPMS